MYAQVEKPKENKSRAVANSVVQKKSNVKQGFEFMNKSNKKTIQKMENNSFHKMQTNSRSEIVQLIKYRTEPGGKWTNVANLNELNQLLTDNKIDPITEANVQNELTTYQVDYEVTHPELATTKLIDNHIRLDAHRGGDELQLTINANVEQGGLDREKILEHISGYCAGSIENNQQISYMDNKITLNGAEYEIRDDLEYEIRRLLGAEKTNVTAALSRMLGKHDISQNTSLQSTTGGNVLTKQQKDGLNALQKGQHASFGSGKNDGCTIFFDGNQIIALGYHDKKFKGKTAYKIVSASPNGYSGGVYLN